MSELYVTGGLVAIVGLVLALPFLSKRVERQLEAFLFVMGCLAVTISGLWSLHLVEKALVEPIKITLAGLMFRFVRSKVGERASAFAGRRWLYLRRRSTSIGLLATSSSRC